MSLGVVIKGPEGMVLAADSRVTLQAQTAAGDPPIVVTFDNATKLLSFESETHRHVGAVTYGAAVIGLRTAHSFVPELELILGPNRLTVAEYAGRLRDFFLERWNNQQPAPPPQPGMSFVVGGYDPGAPYGTVYAFEIPSGPGPVQQTADDFGMTWGGQLEVAARLVSGFDPQLPTLLAQQLAQDPAEMQRAFQALRPQIEARFPYQILPLQDCVDLATFLIRTTVTAQALAVGIRGVGGQIEVATITQTAGLKYVQRKEIRGEALR